MTDPHQTPGQSTGAPRVIGTRHEIADRNIARYQQALKDGTGNPTICREMIDKWLEYRLGPNDERRL
jgi:hypothetical protein